MECSTRRHVIEIADFDFSCSEIEIDAGDTVEFRLSACVPVHAEHMLVGYSDCMSSCFESSILSVSFWM